MENKQSEILLKLESQKSKWEMLSVALKALCLLAVTGLFLFGRTTALDLRGLVAFPVLGFAMLDVWCGRKLGMYRANLDAAKASPEEFFFDDSRKGDFEKRTAVNLFIYGAFLIVSILTAQLFL